MSTAILEFYDALRSAGFTEDNARRAAKALTTYDPQIAELKADMRVMKWQLGALVAFAIPALLLLLRVASKVGALAF